MKKILLAAVAALAIVGCSQNEEIENVGQKTKIDVTTAVKGTTRAAVTNNDTFTAFTVSGYTVVDIANSGLGTAYMNEDYTGKKGNWTTTGDDVYWPLNEKMEFFAYPTTLKANFQVPPTGYPTLSYTIGDNATAQTDLVVAHKSVSSVPTDGKLILTFKHLLTRINFSYKPENNAYAYTVSSITIKGVEGGNATYTFDADDKGNWSAGSDKNVDYVYPVLANPTAGDDGVYALDTDNGSLMLLPQSVASKTISVTYKTVKDGHTYFDDTKVVTLGADANWGIGQAIRYTLTLPVGATKMTVDTDVEDINNEAPESGSAE